MPSTGGDQRDEFDAAWLALLDACGAIGLLLDGTVDAADWLSSWDRHRQRGWRQRKRLVEELALVERLAPRLIADGKPVRLLREQGWNSSVDSTCWDIALAAGVPVADPSPETEGLELRYWTDDERPGRRDLAAVTADPRFTPLLRRAVESLSLVDGPASGPSARVRRLADHPSLRTAVAGWLRDRATHWPSRSACRGSTSCWPRSPASRHPPYWRRHRRPSVGSSDSIPPRSWAAPCVRASSTNWAGPPSKRPWTPSARSLLRRVDHTRGSVSTAGRTSTRTPGPR